MSLPIKNIPPRFKALLSFYKKCFTRPQYKNFRDFVLGLIVSDNKAIQEINDCFGRVDQSSLNRFLTCSEWDPAKINNKRLSQIKSHHKLKKGIFICDPTFLQHRVLRQQQVDEQYLAKSRGCLGQRQRVNSFFTD